MPKALELKDQIFGHLKVIQKAPNKGKKTYWLCECLLCGTQKEIQTCHLTSGATKSCGCQNIENLKKDNKEIKCILCQNTFVPNNMHRKYCYDCSPSGMSAADSQRRKKRILKHIMIEYKDSKCECCGYNKCEGALQFHHLDPKLKEFTISQINLNDTNFSFDIIKSEIDKCQLLCANCHAEKHYKED